MEIGITPFIHILDELLRYLFYMPLVEVSIPQRPRHAQKSVAQNPSNQRSKSPDSLEWDQYMGSAVSRTVTK